MPSKPLGIPSPETIYSFHFFIAAYISAAEKSVVGCCASQPPIENMCVVSRPKDVIKPTMLAMQSRSGSGWTEFGTTAGTPPSFTRSSENQTRTFTPDYTALITFSGSHVGA